MGRRLLLNLLLGAIALALALFILLGPGETPEPGSTAISDLDPEQVSSIRLTRRQGAPLAFHRRGEQWYLAGERELPADAFQVGTLLSLAGTTTDRRYPADTLEPETLGLSPARATLILDDERFDIGDTDPLEKRRYVLNGASVYLVVDRYQHLLNARFTNFVDRRLLPAAAVVTGLSLPGLSLQRDAENHWRVQPDDPALGADAIRTLVSAWEHARALYVREYDGAAGEEILVRLQHVDEPVRLILLAREPDIILARPAWGIQYHLAGGADSGLLEPGTTAMGPGAAESLLSAGPGT